MQAPAIWSHKAGRNFYYSSIVAIDIQPDLNFQEEDVKLEDKEGEKKTEDKEGEEKIEGEKEKEEPNAEEEKKEEASA